MSARSDRAGCHCSPLGHELGELGMGVPCIQPDRSARGGLLSERLRHTCEKLDRVAAQHGGLAPTLPGRCEGRRTMAVGDNVQCTVVNSPSSAKN